MDIQSFRADDSIESVINKYMNMVFGIALSHTRNRTDADDVFQEVFYIYFKKNISFHDEEHRKAWLIRTTINCSKKIAGSIWNRRTVALNESKEEVFEFSSDEESLIYTSLRELPKKYRIVLYLFYFECMSVIEISEALHIKPGTVKVQLNRGRERMREKLKGEYFYE